jgi:sec-independent protein translocase protein TatA
MPNLGGPELIIVLAIFVLLFGAKKLPELGGSIGKSIKNFKRGIDEASAEEDEEAQEAEDTATSDTSVTRDQS